MCLEVLDRHWLDPVSQFETENPGIKVQFSIKRSLNARGAPKAVLLTFKRNIRHRHPFLSQGLDHYLSLTGRHDFVLKPLEENHGARESIDKVDR
jgi:hypothetical protein